MISFTEIVIEISVNIARWIKFQNSLISDNLLIICTLLYLGFRTAVENHSIFGRFLTFLCGVVGRGFNGVEG